MFLKIGVETALGTIIVYISYIKIQFLISFFSDIILIEVCTITVYSSLFLALTINRIIDCKNDIEVIS